MNFNIKYPPLVEQAYSHFISIGLHPNKDKLYKMLVDEGMILNELVSWSIRYKQANLSAMDGRK